MNIISYEKAFCLYPKGTFEEQCTLVTGCQSREKRQRALDKYRDRGWEVLHNMHRRRFHLVQRHRWICDRHTWIMPLDLDGVTPPPVSSYCDPLLATNWVLERKGFSGAKMTFDVILCHTRLFPIVNHDDFVLDMVSRMLCRDKVALRGGGYWPDDESVSEVATEQTP